MTSSIKKNYKIVFIFLVFLHLFGCAYQNRTVITSLSEFNGKLYIATGDGNFKAFDIDKEKFKKIDYLDGKKITKMLKTNERFFVEATEFGKDEDNFLETVEYIYSVGEQGNFEELFDIRTRGRKQYISSLMAVDDKYIYALRNTQHKTSNDNYAYNVNEFRYDIEKREKIAHHFDELSNIVVEDIYEDNDSYWYVCYDRPVAKHWISIEGQMAIIRRDKTTNELKQFAIGNELSHTTLRITGDKSHVYVFKYDSSRVYQINKNDFSYNILNIVSFSELSKEHSYGSSEDYLWLISNNNLYRIRKYDLQKVRIDFGEFEVRAHNALISDSDFVWVGFSKINQPHPGFADIRSPYLLKISKDSMQKSEIPVETSFSEGLNNMKRSFSGYIGNLFLWMMGGKM